MVEFHPEELWGFIVGIFQLIIGLVIGVFAIYMGVKFVDKLTKNIEEMQELKKGNVSVGIFIFAIIITFATVLQSGVAGLTGAISTATEPIEYIVGLVIGIIQLVISIGVGAGALYIAISIIEKMSKEIDRIKVKGMPKMKFDWEEELKKNNIAFAIFIAGILIGLGFVIQSGVAGIASSLSGIITA